MRTPEETPATAARDAREDPRVAQEPCSLAEEPLLPAARPGPDPDVAAILNALDPFWTRVIVRTAGQGD